MGGGLRYSFKNAVVLMPEISNILRQRLQDILSSNSTI